MLQKLQIQSLLYTADSVTRYAGYKHWACLNSLQHNVLFSTWNPQSWYLKHAVIAIIIYDLDIA